MPTWTNEQLEAIEKENTNIIVSAGAGSGKTAVLTARVIRKLQQNVDIDKLLILTFTKAAASEMKERIRTAINKEGLISQLERIDQAYITTFDSYAFSIVKKYHYLLNISKNLKIGESAIFEIEKRKILDDLFEEYYDQENLLFLNLINSFCIKDDEMIRTSILKINNKLDLIYYKEQYLDDMVNNNFKDQYLDNVVNDYLKMIVSKQNEIKNNLNTLSLSVDGDYFDKLNTSIINLLNSDDYNILVRNKEFKMPNLPRNSEEFVKVLKNNISLGLKELIELLKFESVHDIKEAIKSTCDYVLIIKQIITEFDKRLNYFKEVNNIYEFIDINKMAIRIVLEHENVRLELKNYFNEIMIDEYQDTNDLQELFISSISNNNVYMVGDIKQSIYRFRNANPSIFKDKYDKYSKDILGYKIDLNKNFRSREEVLNNINLIFNKVMDDFLGSANYKESHQMIFGNSTYNVEGNTNQDNNFEILNYKYDKESIYTKEEIEIFITANDILKKIKDNYKIFDKDTLLLRNCNFNDFVILIDRSTNFDLYKRIFSSLNIPISLLKDESISNEIEIGLIKNIINMIICFNNKNFGQKFKYSFMSVARSYLFRMSDNEIFKYFSNNNYSDSDIIKIIGELSKQIDNVKPSTFINEIITKFDFYSKCITKGEVTNSLNILEYLVTMTKSLEESNYNIYDIFNYLNDIANLKLDLKYSVNDEVSESVKIMTIHKSKGLEFPICYFPLLNSDFNLKDVQDKFLFNNKYGIVTPLFKEGIEETIIKKIIYNNYITEEISEKIRLFYVALTRAKEKMIFITNLDDDKTEFNDTVRLKYRCFKDMLNSIKEDVDMYVKEVDLNNININKNYGEIKQILLNDIVREKNNFILKNMNINKDLIEEKTFSKKTNELYSKEIVNNIELGLRFHEVLEFIDFNKCNLDDLNIEPFIKEKLDLFLNQDIFKTEIRNYYQEHEFIYESDNSYHGIIDLLLEFDDKYVIIDYKLKNIEDNNYIKQLDGYRKYLQTKTDKNIYIYLYSILNNEMKEVI